MAASTSRVRHGNAAPALPCVAPVIFMRRGNPGEAIGQLDAAIRIADGLCHGRPSNAMSPAFHPWTHSALRRGSNATKVPAQSGRTQCRCK